MTRPTIVELLKYFLYLWSLGFGGPVALVGYMRQRASFGSRAALRQNDLRPAHQFASP